ncbi:MAG: DUF3808 domain-containing protein [candidate division NC10 bacterium]|nr:DUF3808 domain-containing protein [candidate division NC10 bacterium]
MNSMGRFFVIVLLAGVLVMGLSLPGEADHFHPPARSSILAAIDHLLNQDPDAAEGECRRLEGLDTSGLLASFCASYVLLTRAEEKDDPTEDLERFRKEIGDIIEKLEKALEKAPKDADLLFLTGMAWGYKALADGVLKNYFSAYKGLKNSYNFFQETLKVDPHYYDAYHGLGLYHYSISLLPSFSRAIASLILPSGNQEQGLKELELVAEKGVYLKMMARFALLRIYAAQEGGDYEKALGYARELLDRYPGNPDVYFYLAFIASELGQSEEAFATARRIEQNIQEERNHFSKVMLPRYLQLMGKLSMDQGDYQEALTYFTKAIDSGNKRYAWAVAWAWTRMGMIYDLQGNREEAKRHYRRALQVDSESLAKDYAKRYLDEPYRGQERKG